MSLSAAPVYYLAPHADDAALSCAGSMALDVLSGRPVTLVTVFLSGQHAERRRQEDEQAATALGCRYLSLELPDAPDRPEVRNALDLFMPYGPPHLGITNEVLSRLLWHIQAKATVIAPLAVGGHIDHRIVHEAARSLAYRLGHQVALAFYEDQPYSLIPFAFSRRLYTMSAMLLNAAEQKLDPAHARPPLSVEIAAYRKMLLGWPFMQKGIPIWREIRCQLAARRAVASDFCTLGHRPGFRPWLSPSLRAVGTVAAKRKQALVAYSSQWPLFASSVDVLLAQLEKYGRSTRCADGELYERLWFDEGVYGHRDPPGRAREK